MGEGCGPVYSLKCLLYSFKINGIVKFYVFKQKSKAMTIVLNIDFTNFIQYFKSNLEYFGWDCFANITPGEVIGTNHRKRKGLCFVLPQNLCSRSLVRFWFYYNASLLEEPDKEMNRLRQMRSIFHLSSLFSNGRQGRFLQVT